MKKFNYGTEKYKSATELTDFERIKLIRKDTGTTSDLVDFVAYLLEDGFLIGIDGVNANKEHKYYEGFIEESNYIYFKNTLEEIEKEGDLKTFPISELIRLSDLSIEEVKQNLSKLFLGNIDTDGMFTFNDVAIEKGMVKPIIEPNINLN